ncbi:MAG TPA: IS91 family transposase [Nitrospirae bacterium]|nr:IS91 family transposase [Nitrospirota bacterium]HDZ01694.1 IS91 family transposase [Nitrospirota bacterium]
MSAIQNIFKLYAPEYLNLYGSAMPETHRKTISAIQQCRHGTFGANVFRCDSCGNIHITQCSCGNRHCPTCQNDKAALWLQRQLNNLLPCSYFLITFTVPDELRPFVRSNQQAAYSAMFSAASDTLKTLAKDKHYVGVDKTGFTAVLHTWGRQLQYHPHIHFIVPGGGLSNKSDQKWLPSKPDFFIRVEPLSIIYKAKFRDAMKKAGLFHSIDPAVWRKDWVVHSKAVGDGRASLKYLAPYVFRVAISNSRIVSYDNHQVVFRYKKSGSNRLRTMTLDAMEFIRRFLQHVLPHGFMKIRHYGLLSSNSSAPIEKVRELISVVYEVVKLIVDPVLPKPNPVTCKKCGHSMQRTKFISARNRAPG